MMQYVWYFLATWLLVPTLYVFYIAGVTILKKRDELHKGVFWFCAPIIATAIVLDVILQVTLAWLIFWNKPEEWTFTQRMQRYKLAPGGWRKKVAHYVCEHFLNPFDEGHC